MVLAAVGPDGPLMCLLAHLFAAQGSLREGLCWLMTLDL